VAGVTLRKIVLAGSHYEIGRKLGDILKGERGYPPKYSKEVLEKARGYEEQVKRFASELLDECRGIADSLGIDYYVPVTFEVSPYRFQTAACLVMAISGEHTANGVGVLARNHEWMEKDSENLRLCYTKPNGKLKSLGFTFSWPLVSRYGGINEGGLALSSNAASFDTTGPGIMSNIATRWVLDTCVTTEEAVAYLEKMPKVWGEIYVIIDKNNTIAKVEAHREKTVVTYTETGFDFNSLLYDAPEMQQYMTQERVSSCIEYTSARRVFLNQWFHQNKGQITDDRITAALRSHDHKMCAHGLEGLEICWSYILKTEANTVLVCAGRPCKNEFIEVEGPQ
jgi:predicted choloylglycine hydrolase